MMGNKSEEKRMNRPNPLLSMIERRREKKRAPSIDETLESVGSTLFDRSSRNLSPSNSLQNVTLDCSALIGRVEEIDTRDSHMTDSSYKQDIALANRVASLTAQERLVGEAHPDVLFSLQSLAAFHRRRGEYAQSQRILEEIQVRGVRAKNKFTASDIPSEIFLRS